MLIQVSSVFILLPWLWAPTSQDRAVFLPEQSAQGEIQALTQGFGILSPISPAPSTGYSHPLSNNLFSNMILGPTYALLSKS